MKDWYKENIEEPIRPLVKLLRDNGFNTTCSCGHKNYVECQYIPDGDIAALHNLMFNNGYRNYIITVKLNVILGVHYSTIEVQIT